MNENKEFAIAEGIPQPLFKPNRVLKAGGAAGELLIILCRIFCELHISSYKTKGFHEVDLAFLALTTKISEKSGFQKKKGHNCRSETQASQFL